MGVTRGQSEARREEDWVEEQIRRGSIKQVEGRTLSGVFGGRAVFGMGS